VVFDTNFLVSLAGQSKRLPRSRALAFRDNHAAAASYIARVTALEFEAGFDSAAQAAPHLAAFTILPVDEDVWKIATLLFRKLRRDGLPIGLADTLIAAIALAYGLPLVTDNAEHFRRVRGLKVHGF